MMENAIINGMIIYASLVTAAVALFVAEKLVDWWRK